MRMWGAITQLIISPSIKAKNDNKHNEDEKQGKRDASRCDVHERSIAVLSDVAQDGTLTWYCQAREDEDDPPCNIFNTCSLDDLIYQEASSAKRPGRGAVMVLPPCECGAVCYLKADYTAKELYKAVLPLVDEESNCVYA